MELHDFDFLLTKDKIEEDDDIKDVLNDKTKFSFAARGEAAMRQVRRGEIIQVGYNPNPIYFLNILDSREKVGYSQDATTNR